MSKNKPFNLAPLVNYYWLQDGSPLLSDKDMVSRGMKADKELEKSGLNPAKIFRKHRQEFEKNGRNKNSTAYKEMIEYVRRGWYEYPFHPKFRRRKT